ncbi:hypothetical protein MKY15_19610 [Sporosarcina sp. FSL K6-1540]|uniref:Uncharacterized protein n=1 Tax=Sporosarcina psychrophila TaxID=1476 RepID=A0ABV2KET7_SPOPS
MNELKKLSMMSKLSNKEGNADMKVKERASLKELGTSMAKDSLKKVLVKI